MTMRIEGPEDRETYHFSVDEARAFLRSWYRVVAPDGSTVAYAPARVTATMIADRTFQHRELIAAAKAVLETMEVWEQMTDSKFFRVHEADSVLRLCVEIDRVERPQERS